MCRTGHCLHVADPIASAKCPPGHNRHSVAKGGSRPTRQSRCARQRRHFQRRCRSRCCWRWRRWCFFFSTADTALCLRPTSTPAKQHHGIIIRIPAHGVLRRTAAATTVDRRPRPSTAYKAAFAVCSLWASQASAVRLRDLADGVVRRALAKSRRRWDRADAFHAWGAAGFLLVVRAQNWYETDRHFTPLLAS